MYNDIYKEGAGKPRSGKEAIAPTTQPTDELIAADEVTISPRGRHKEIDENLAASLKSLKPGQAIRLASTFGNVPKEKRSSTSQVIRKHWDHVRSDESRIDYTPEGVPQVQVRVRKAR